MTPMIWPTYAILAYLIIATQLALGDLLVWRDASPNFVLPVAVFIAMHARREDALLGVFLLGFLQDLVSQQPLGLYAFSYGLVGLFVVGARPNVYRNHPLTHLFITLAAGLLTGAVLLLNDWAYPVLHPATDWPKPSLFRVLASAGYTALLAPLLLGGLARVQILFGFRNNRAQIPPTRSWGSA